MSNYWLPAAIRISLPRVGQDTFTLCPILTSHMCRHSELHPRPGGLHILSIHRHCLRYWEFQRKRVCCLYLYDFWQYCYFFILVSPYLLFLIFCWRAHVGITPSRYTQPHFSVCEILTSWSGSCFLLCRLCKRKCRLGIRSLSYPWQAPKVSASSPLLSSTLH